uniref:E3 ubiquitin-protein ligase Sina-like RING finger domain-containing protein n=1 Tax=Bombyx mori TaxID=7091 RepID=A0A8R2LZ43_BOMMO|nr:E3 ubiquitin-protein ligase SINAT3 isoform X4 [Bombyx mori]
MSQNLVTQSQLTLDSESRKSVVLNSLLETDHYESIIKDLTCKRCSKYMKPPIHLCVDGHSICGPCYDKSYQCHVCKKEFSPIRSAVLESLANKVLFPCTNAGCPKHATLPLLEKHTPHCQFRIINCFMARVYGRMMWTVLVNDDNAEKFYFEIDIFLPNLPSKRIVYRRPCKCEKDADFLEHTQNVYIPVENVFSMLDDSEALNFIVRIGEVENLPLLDTPTDSESRILLNHEDHK